MMKLPPKKRPPGLPVREVERLLERLPEIFVDCQEADPRFQLIRGRRVVEDQRKNGCLRIWVGEEQIKLGAGATEIVCQLASRVANRLFAPGVADPTPAPAFWVPYRQPPMVIILGRAALDQHLAGELERKRPGVTLAHVAAAEALLEKTAIQARLRLSDEELDVLDASPGARPPPVRIRPLVSSLRP